MAENFMEEYGQETSREAAERTLSYFRELFSLEMPLGRMMKMMPGMVKFAMHGKDTRVDLLKFVPQMMPMMKAAVSGKREG
ncbi:Hypothetical protein DEACI_2896 [Acididesulfobacillus acetoxydans]|uniref:Uncharacterized protein n=1 Tax=Acididesulfobacillus acetoxydans TaxID=1561005 RepID=A0A8S0VXS0_9FIRM|nr:hypothetical protein [Acididesulfobacillus acetoxydans]CAA7602223.1 Hypothetical protein DEACI_2896 [Acididesulfobacillus acetoxydans]CEJ07559.1 Hypothetical protein DEACI_2025 [Acididesulfobacillus acetoxydans]